MLSVATDDTANTQPNKQPRKPRENGGRYGFNDYMDAPVTHHDVEGTKLGDPCECCSFGRYYYGEDRKQLEFTGGPILKVKKHVKKALRCNRCGHEKVNYKKIVKWVQENWKQVQANPEAYLRWCFKNETERIAA